GGRNIDRVPNAVEQPVSVLFDVHDRVPGAAGRSMWRRYLRRAVFHSDVGDRKTDRFNVDTQLQSLVLGKQLREELLNPVPALDATAALVRVVAIGSPEGGQGFGLSLVEGVYKRFRILLQGGFLLSVVLALG